MPWNFAVVVLCVTGAHLNAADDHHGHAASDVTKPQPQHGAAAPHSETGSEAGADATLANAPTSATTAAGVKTGALLSLSTGDDDGDPLTELLAQLKSLDARIEMLRRTAAEPIARDALWAAARAGLATALGPDGEWLDAAAVAARGHGVASQREGFGFSWNPATGQVARVIAGSPADAAGLRSGDRITQLAELTIKPENAEVAECRLEALEHVELTVISAATTGAKRTCTMARALFADSGIDPVVIVRSGVALIRIHRFAPAAPAGEVPGTAQALATAVSTAVGTLGAAHVVIDLRGCASEEFSEAVAACGWLLPTAAQPYVIARLVSGGQRKSEPAKWEPANQEQASPGKDRALQVPGAGKLGRGTLTVLVDGATAGAAELLAVGLRDQGGARLVGATTAGQCRIRKLLTMPEGDGYVVTTAHVRDAQGRGWSGGVVPDDVIIADDAARVAAWSQTSPASASNDPVIARALALMSR